MMGDVAETVRKRVAKEIQRQTDACWTNCCVAADALIAAGLVGDGGARSHQRVSYECGVKERHGRCSGTTEQRCGCGCHTASSEVGSGTSSAHPRPGEGVANEL